MAICHAKFTFPGSLPLTSGPYVTGFDFEAPDESAMASVLSDLDAWWTAATAFRNLLDVALGTPELSASGEFSSGTFDLLTTATDTPGGSAPALPGASLRAIKLANRPRGGRRGSMFWPGLESTAYDPQGELEALTISTADLALTNLVGIVAGTTGAEMVQVHVIGGVTTVSPVFDFTIAPTVSYLNRRYR